MDTRVTAYAEFRALFADHGIPDSVLIAAFNLAWAARARAT